MKKPVLFLTLTEKTIPGGMEVYAHYLRKVIPSMQIVGRETLEEHVHARRTWPFLRDVHHGKRLYEYVRTLSIRPALVLTNGMNGWAFPKKKTYPVVNILHGTFAGLAENGYSKADPLYWRMRHIFSRFEKKSAERATIRVANSHFTQREAHRYYGVDSRVIEPSIDMRMFRPEVKKNSLKKMGWSPDRKHVLFVGNPTYSKGFDRFQELARAHPEWEFHAILQPRVDSVITNLHTMAPLPHSELVHAYCAADAFVFPSRYEGFGFAPLEALSSGCPVITSKVGVFHDFQTENARVVSHSFESFNGALVDLIRDPPKRMTPKNMDRFSPRRFEKEWKAVLEEAHVP